MKTRCLNPNDYHFKYYGARGISICKEWLDFKTFMAWAISNGYKDNLTIDRIDNDGDYNPKNCRWVTMAAQNKNRRGRSGKSGIPHIQLYQNGYRVQIRRNKIIVVNRLFRDLNEAIAFRDKVLTELEIYEIEEAS